MNSKPTIVNECEFTQMPRKYKPKFISRFSYERNEFDFSPELSEWMDQVFDCSLMSKERFDRCRVATIFVSFMYPFIEDLKLYEMVVKIYVYMFVMDDHMEINGLDMSRDKAQGNSLFAQLMSVADRLQYPEQYASMSTWKPYCMAYYAVFEDVFQDYEDFQIKRMSDYIRDWIEACIEERIAIENGLNSLTIDDMLRIRVKCGASYVAIQLLEYQDNIRISGAEWNHPLMQELMTSISIVFVYHNDLYSFEKEYQEQNYCFDRMFNIVALNVLKKDITVKEAMDLVIGQTKEQELNANVLMIVLNNVTISGNVKTFVERSGYLMGGSGHLSSVIDRYNKIV